MKIYWMGHGSFRIEIAQEVILIDPWLHDNPMLEAAHYDAAIAGATQIFVTHGHFDHTVDIVEVSQKTGAPVHAMYELAQHLYGLGATEGVPMNKGGTETFGTLQAAMVPASHSSSMEVDGRGAYMGAEVGYVFLGEGKTLYLSGDTDIMADMDWIGDYYKPQIGILSAGGRFTMDMAKAAYAAKRYFDFETVIPCHYKTFPILEQSAEVLIKGLPGVSVIEPEVMRPIAL